MADDKDKPTDVEQMFMDFFGTTLEETRAGAMTAEESAAWEANAIQRVDERERREAEETDAWPLPYPDNVPPI